MHDNCKNRVFTWNLESLGIATFTNSYYAITGANAYYIARVACDISRRREYEHDGDNCDEHRVDTNRHAPVYTIFQTDLSHTYTLDDVWQRYGF